MEAGHPVGDGEEEPAQQLPVEAHPLNPAATRRPGGYWNEDSLPILE